MQVLPPRRHAFTHFALTLLPRRLDVRTPPPVVREDGQIWLPLADIGAAPLPAPVLALLREIAAGHQAAAAVLRSAGCRDRVA